MDGVQVVGQEKLDVVRKNLNNFLKNRKYPVKCRKPFSILEIPSRVGKLSFSNVIRVPKARQHPTHSRNFISSKFLIEQP